MGWVFWSSETVAATEGPEDREMATVFNWTRNRKTWVHLVSFLVFSVLIHGAGFYLFQVIYPSPLRVEPEGDAISFLDPADPSVRALLQRIEDRTVYLIPPSERSGDRVSLDEMEVRFTPSFRGGEISPVPLRYDWTMPPKLNLPGGPPLGERAGAQSGVAFEKSGGLRAREIAPWSIMEDYLSRADWLPELGLTLRVDREGMVEVTEIRGQLEEDDRADFKRVVESTLRFVPAESESEGELAVRPAPAIARPKER